MKLILALLCVAEIVQVSLAGSIGRTEVNASTRYDIEAVLNNFKNLVGRIAATIKAVLKDMPSNIEYNEYRRDFEYYLIKYDEKKDKFDGCFANVYTIVQEFVKVYNPLELDDAPPEAQEVRKLFYNHGLKEIEVDTEELVKTLILKEQTNEIKEVADSLTPEYKHNILNRCNSSLMNI